MSLLIEIELGKQLQEKQTEWKKKYDGFGMKTLPDGTKSKEIPANELEGLNGLMAEINDLGKKYEDIRKVNAFADEMKEFDLTGDGAPPTPRYGSGGRVKTLGDLMYDAKLFGGKLKTGADVAIQGGDAHQYVKGLQGKSTMTTSANGYAPEVVRDGTVVPYISRPPQLIDYLTIQPYTQNAIKYVAQTVRTNAAAAKGEGSALDESTITYAEQTDNIYKVGTWIPATEEQLEDVEEVRNLIDGDLRLMVFQELDRQLTVGTGANEIKGIYSGASIQTYAKTAQDTPFDAFFKAMTKVRVGGRANPGLFVMHSTDHQNIALQRTADGVYIMGNPADGPIMRMWGLPIALSEALTVTNGLCFDPFYFKVKMRRDVSVKVSDSHGSNFTAGILAFRADCRAGLARYREAAACKVTGLPS